MPLTKPNAKQITYTSASGAVRTVNDWLTTQLVSVKEFGALGDGSTNDTAAFNAAITYMTTNSKPVLVPPGTYRITAIQLHSGSNHSYGGFIGLNKRNTVIQDLNTSTGPLITVGDAAMTTYEGNLLFSNITFRSNGNATGSTPFRLYDLAWTTFDNCAFEGGEAACDCRGGVNVSFNECGFHYAKIGLNIRKFTRTGGGWPNNIKVNGGVAGSNSEWGIYFDDGRQLILNGVQIEGNGTTPGSVWHGGLYVGANVGAETAIDGSNAQQGVIATGCWFEANNGIADVNLKDGINSLEDCLFWSQNTWVTNNIRIEGGKYHLNRCDAAHTFTAGVPNVYEGASVWAGNSITDCEFSYITWNSANTTLSTGSALYAPAITSNSTVTATTGISTKGLNVAGTYNSLLSTTQTNPVFCYGYSAGSTSVITIQLNKTLNTNSYPVVITPVHSTFNTAPTIYITSQTATSFDVRVNTANAAVPFYWMAIGTQS